MILKSIARLVFKLRGWEVRGKLPEHPMKFVLIIGSHTCDMDVVLALGAASILRVPLKLLVTKEAFTGIKAPLLRALGAVPVNKNAQGGMVGEVARMYKKSEAFVMALAPEGSKFKTQTLRTGFWYIARKAEVPLILCSWDYKNKVMVVGPTYHVTDNIEDDLNFIWNYYKNNGIPRWPKRGISGEMVLPPLIKLKEELIKKELAQSQSPSK